MKHLALFVLLLTACDTRVPHARILMRRGQYDAAREMLIAKHKEDGGNAESRMLLGEIDLHDGKFEDAQAVLAPLKHRKEMAARVAQVYRKGAHDLELKGDAATMAKAALEAVHLDPATADDMCQTILGRMRRDHSAAWYPIVAAAREFGPTCQRNAVAVLRAWITDPRTERTKDVTDLALMGRTIDPTAASDLAHDVRTVAQRRVDAGSFVDANELITQIGQIDPAVLREPETVALKKSAGPVELVPAQPGEVETPSYSGMPLEITKRVMKEIGQLLSRYQAEHGEYPRGENFSEMWLKVYSYSSQTLHTEDGWSRSFAYVSDGKRARLISGGADQKIDFRSKNLDSPGGILVDEAGADIIWENGSIVQEPLESAIRRISG